MFATYLSMFSPPPRRLFLIDGMGALLSAISLGVVLPYWQPLFGMPVRVLLPLAAVALGFAFYSLGCYWRFPGRWRAWLRGIAMLNITYILATLFLTVLHWAELTLWGKLYFVGEAIVVLSLAAIEWRTAHR